MDFSSTLRPNEVVIWNAAIQRQRENEAARPAPRLVEETRPRMCRKPDPCAGSGPFRIRDPQAEQLIHSLRQKWGLP